MKWASSLCEGVSLDDLLKKCVQEIEEQMGDTVPDLVFFFISPHFRKDYETAAEDLYQRLPCRLMLGCSAGGLIGSEREIEHQAGISIVAAHLPGVSLHPFYLRDSDIRDMDCSPTVWEDLLKVEAGDSPHFVLIADPFTFRAEDFLMGIDFAYPKAVKVGGLASGASRAGENRLFLNGQTYSEGLIGVGLTGNVQVDTLVAQGCRPIGSPFLVTKADYNLLLELDYKPTLHVLQDLLTSLNELDRTLAQQALFLGIVMDPLKENISPGDFLIRNLMGVVPDQNALAIGAILNEGQWVQFHVRDARTSAEDLEAHLTRYISEPHEGHLSGALLFSCMGRGFHLYGEPNHDTKMFHQHLGNFPMGGFFCNGEIGPIQGVTHLHGYTSSFGLFRPKEGPSK
ncbi:MAG: FIST C-terminal domain-containing protein [Nitrospirae bacterium]|nr:FIST C-terminal domain-containing protein [Nitrospirota bacterium]